jgi:peptidoglycan/xylan/chitin deacetylase (PgdA/CDA1 family)
MRALADNGWKTVTVSELVTRIRAGKNLKEKTCVLTFDDGYESVYTQALPRLLRFGFNATVFLVTDHCGGDNRWPGQLSSVPRENMLNWGQIKRLSDAGFEIGAHTRTHLSLLNAPPDKIVTELACSRDEIERIIDTQCRAFAYPYGDVNSSLVNFVRRFFDCAVATNLGFVEDTSDIYSLPRIDAYYLNPRWIPQLQRNRFKEYLRLRQAMRSIRRLVYSDYQFDDEREGKGECLIETPEPIQK